MLKEDTHIGIGLLLDMLDQFIIEDFILMLTSKCSVFCHTKHK